MIEKELVEQLKSGNETAFRQLVETYQSMVVNTAMGMIHNQTDAEDIAQDVFIQVYHSISDFRNESSLKTWLYRITITRSLNAIRANKRRKFFSCIEDFFQGKKEEVQEKAGFVNPDKALEEKDHANAIRAALDSLPENQKIAFALSKYEELSYAEIAELMQISKSSVESLLFRAKSNLQKKLIGYYKNFKK
ncbi:RNA polymerase sigma factor [Labilibaculum manganireducens]|uniref:RNA polymerase sigma factor n=1 Tax=Labilibaculum manganireducens TaxID=1940525 RepID=UPI0029F51AFC|nr:RNA polymerase sigma factor [Labilibaculum manganireducens]